MAKLRIGVLMGGKSVENEVSFNSGRTICDHLDTGLYEVMPLFQTQNGTLYILPQRFLHRGKISDFAHRLDHEAQKICWDDLKTLIDFVYIAMHGRFAEDGTLQGMLAVLGIPYLGAKVFASALTRDKIFMYKFLKAEGFDVPKHIAIQPHELPRDPLYAELINKLNNAGIAFPCVVKPHKEGSSLGISVVEHHDALYDAIYKAASVHPACRQAVIIEEKLIGVEFCCIVITNSETGDLLPLPPTEVVIEQQASIFDYDQKYMPGRATKYTPARCLPEVLSALQKECMKAMKALEATNIIRTDGFYTPDGRIVLIDQNTITGMAPASFIFRQAAEIGMSHAMLINHLIKTELKMLKGNRYA